MKDTNTFQIDGEADIVTKSGSIACKKITSEFTGPYSLDEMVKADKSYISTSIVNDFAKQGIRIFGGIRITKITKK